MQTDAVEYTLFFRALADGAPEDQVPSLNRAVGWRTLYPSTLRIQHPLKPHGHMQLGAVE